MISFKKTEKYFKQHPAYNATAHFLGGLGVGILITYPFITHTLRWGIFFILLAVFAHLYPILKK